MVKMEFKDYGHPIISLELVVDEDTRILHILDESLDSHAFLTWFNESMQSRILNRLGEPDDPLRWTWLCYNQDGFLTEYRFEFRHIPFDAYKLHEPFALEMTRRLRVWIGADINLGRLGDKTSGAN
ncbi:hypothetical protein JZ785_20865 [Alicyclobacillus curvatus]|jgi:hypothetical protein|nr:hypothetical protein JZ785_20865 [Alicyclobacillus curvatus]